MVKPAERLDLLNSQSMILPEKCWTDLNCIWHYQRLKKIKNKKYWPRSAPQGGKKKPTFSNESKCVRGKYIWRQQRKMASHEDTWGATLIPKFDTRWWWAVTKQLYSRGKNPGHTKHDAGWASELVCRLWEKKQLILPRNESRFWSCSVRRVVTKPTELSRLQH